MTITDKIKRARKTLQQKQTQKAELEGRRKALMDRLSNDFSVDTVKEGEARLDELEAEIKDKQEQLDDMVSELDELQEEMNDD